jgi:hypothetical protein
MIIIGANRKSLYYRILILFVLWAFFFYFYSHIVWANWDILEIINLIGIGIATVWYTPAILVATLFRAVKVTITPESLSTFSILAGTRTLPFPEIESFSTQTFQSANGRNDRVTIAYKGNKTLKIADVNVESIVPVLEALRDNNIHYTGHTDKQQPRAFRRQQR